MKQLLARCRQDAEAGYSRVPVMHEVVLDGDTPVSAFEKLHRGRYGFLLESLDGDGADLERCWNRLDAHTLALYRRIAARVVPELAHT